MKIIITNRIHELGLNKLRKNNVSFKILNLGQSLPTDLKSYSGLITMFSDNINAKFLKINQHLKVIANHAVGYNNIDLSEANKYNIKIGNTPGVLTDATADLTFALILSVTRNLKQAQENILQGNWKRWEPLGFLGLELKNKTLGIIGMGRIGTAVANRAYHGFEMKIIYYNPTSKNSNSSYKKLSLDQLLATSDIVSIHCPLNSQTKKMINESFIKKMKKGSYLINTARGEIHCEEALLNGLNSSQLKGVGLDVTSPEPMSSKSKLLSHPSSIILPHIGSATEQARSAMSLICAENIINGLNELPLSHPVLLK